MEIDKARKKIEPVKIVNHKDGKAVSPPDKKVAVLEIDENENFGLVEHMITPAKKPGDLALFIKTDQDARKENNPHQPTADLARKIIVMISDVRLNTLLMVTLSKRKPSLRKQSPPFRKWCLPL